MPHISAIEEFWGLTYPPTYKGSSLVVSHYDAKDLQKAQAEGYQLYVVGKPK